MQEGVAAVVGSSSVHVAVSFSAWLGSWEGDVPGRRYGSERGSTVFMGSGKGMVRDSESWERYKWVIGDSVTRGMGMW